MKRMYAIWLTIRNNVSQAICKHEDNMRIDIYFACSLEGDPIDFNIVLYSNLNGIQITID